MNNFVCVDIHKIKNKTAIAATEKEQTDKEYRDTLSRVHDSNLDSTEYINFDEEFMKNYKIEKDKIKHDKNDEDVEIRVTDDEKQSEGFINNYIEYMIKKQSELGRKFQKNGVKCLNFLGIISPELVDQKLGYVTEDEAVKNRRLFKEGFIKYIKDNSYQDVNMLISEHLSETTYHIQAMLPNFYYDKEKNKIVQFQRNFTAGSKMQFGFKSR